MSGKSIRHSFVMILSLLCFLMSFSCRQYEPFGNLQLLMSANGIPLQRHGKEIGPGEGMLDIAYLTVTGYSDEGGSIETQTFEINGTLQITGLSAGNWHIGITGLNADQLAITQEAVDDHVEILSGKTTTALFNLTYLAEGMGSCAVTVSWPEDGGWFSQVALGLGTTDTLTVDPEHDAVQALFSSSAEPVGSYDLNLTFTNGTGTTVSLPMMDTVKIYAGLASSGTIELGVYDLMPVDDPVISIADEKTVTLSCDTGGASIYYTTDKTDPVDSGTRKLYTAPFDVADASATIWAVGSCETYRDSNPVGKKMDGSEPDEGIIITVPGTIEGLQVVQDSDMSFSATYTETGSAAKTILWYMDGTEQGDTDNNDTFTYEGSLAIGRHQVMVKIAKGGILYAGSLRFSVTDDDGGGVVVKVPGKIEDLTITRHTIQEFSATYTETGEQPKTIRWYLDGDLQDDTDNDDNFVHTGTFSERRHQLTIKIEKDGNTFASSFRFSPTLDDGSGGVVVEDPGLIEELSVTREADGTFVATYTETGDQAKTIRWYLDSTLQDDSDDNDTHVCSQTLAAGRHQMTVKIEKDGKTFASSLRFTVFGVGSTGPAGGLIVAVNEDPSVGDWTYMEAAPVDEGEACTWSEAIRLCFQASYGGYSDWLLPDKGELEAIYARKEELGGFDSQWYWSSDEDEGGNKAWLLHFGNGLSDYYTKNGYALVRAIRIF